MTSPAREAALERLIKAALEVRRVRYDGPLASCLHLSKSEMKLFIALDALEDAITALSAADDGWRPALERLVEAAEDARNFLDMGDLGTALYVIGCDVRHALAALDALPAADDERIQAVERLTEVWPHMLVAIEIAKIEGTPKIAVLAEFGKGGRIIASFDITFLDDVQLLLPPPPRPEKPDTEGG